jgi:hypothetical protein
MENELQGLRGDGKKKALFEFLVVANATNFSILVFPRKGEVFDTNPDTMDTFVVQGHASMRMPTVAKHSTVKASGTRRLWELVSKRTLASMESLARWCRLS